MLVCYFGCFKIVIIINSGATLLYVTTCWKNPNALVAEAYYFRLFSVAQFILIRHLTSFNATRYTQFDAHVTCVFSAVAYIIFIISWT